jgi:hypothetical protein
MPEDGLPLASLSAIFVQTSSLAARQLQSIWSNGKINELPV